MGAVVAVVSKRGENVVPEAVRMLNVLRHRGVEAHGISTSATTIITRELEELNTLNIKSNIVLGYNFNPILPNDTPQPMDGEGFKAIFEGRLFPQNEKREITGLMKPFNGDVKVEATKIIRDVNGAFVFLVIKNGNLIVGRDPMGAIPLYFGENERFYALASERKALWAIDAQNKGVRSFPPGNLAVINSGNAMFQPVKALRKMRVKLIKEEEALEELYELLLLSVKGRVAGLEKISIAFSGGLDSSIIAALTKKSGATPLLVSVGLEGSKELEHAEKIAGYVGLPLEVKTYTLDDVERVLCRVLWLIEEANPLRASIDIPIFWSAETSLRMDYRVMLLGQGSDELFAGYHKYLREYEKVGENLENILYRDMLFLHEASLEPDEKICSFHGIEARFPYADYDLASFALSLPITLKIESGTDPLRKRILRKLAKRIGLPEDVYLKPKKAIQYGTGVGKALRIIATKKGRKLGSFINQLFQMIAW